MLDLHPLSAERQGFEPRVPRSTTVFKTAAIDHSATSPNPERILNDIQNLYVSFKSGETGIRTPGTSQYNGFQDRRNRPLCHLSKTPERFTEALSFKSDAKVRLIFKNANFRDDFLKRN